MKRTGSAYELIDAIHANVATAQQAERRLGSIAYAMSRLGLMPDIVDELDKIATDIVDAAKAVSGAHGKKQSDDLRSSSELAGTLLKATLAGCIASPKKTKERQP